jgi:capsular polysaccharide export protein
MLPERRVGNTFWCAALWAASYYVAGSLLYPFFRRYRHHRPLTLLEAWPWVRGAWRKVTYRWKERRVMSLLTGPLTKKFFLVPLQMCVDSQVRQHSNFTSVAEFIQHVVASFAEHAPADAVLVVKHHPLDRGYHDYSQMLRKLSRQLRVSDRLLYIHDQHLPTVCEHARGAVVINSTVGLSVLTHSAALKVCGDAIYDLHGLTFQRSLDEFWREADQVRPDMELFERFRSYLIDHTQLNGSFYLGAIDANLSASMASAHEVERRAHSQRSGLPIPSSQT